jgi:hypothetical protein
MNRKSLLLTSLFLLVLTAACSNAANAVPTQGSGAAMPATAETVAATTATLEPTKSIVSSGFPTGSFQPNHPVHTKILVLKEDGTYQNLGIVEEGKTAAEPAGTYTVSGDHVTFLDSPGAASVCQKEPGEYTWSFDGSALAFKMVSDECSERKIDLTNSTWAKQP